MLERLQHADDKKNFFLIDNFFYFNCFPKMVRLNEETLSGSHLAMVTSGKATAKSPYNLPDGWVVEEVPRRDGSHTDKVLSLWSD